MSRRYLSLMLLMAATQPGCDSGEKPQAVPVGPVTVHRSPAPTSAPREEEVAALKDFVDSGPKSPANPSSAPSDRSASARAARPADRATPGMAIPPPPTPSRELKYDVPAEWVTVPPASRFRKAQWTLPRADTDAEDGMVVLSYFGMGQGGGVAGNLMRWEAMFTTEDGKPLPEEAVRQESFKSNGLNVTMVDLSGRYAEAMMPGAAPSAVKSGHRMISAIVETAEGSWFFKCTAPAATLAKHEPGIRGLLKSVRQ